MSDQDLRDLVASLAVAQAKNEEFFRQNAEQQKKTDEQLKELGKQIGGLGQKFGSFTEGMAFASMKALLEGQFHMEKFWREAKAKQGGEEMEIDVLAWANGQVNQAFIVEVKSHLKEEGLTQVLNILSRFPRFFPEYKDKQLFGILATVQADLGMKEKAIEKGLYVADIKEDLFVLNVPPHFKPRDFSEGRAVN